MNFHYNCLRHFQCQSITRNCNLISIAFGNLRISLNEIGTNLKDILVALTLFHQVCRCLWPLNSSTIDQVIPSKQLNLNFYFANLIFMIFNDQYCHLNALDFDSVCFYGLLNSIDIVKDHQLFQVYTKLSSLEQLCSTIIHFVRYGLHFFEFLDFTKTSYPGHSLSAWKLRVLLGSATETAKKQNGEPCDSMQDFLNCQKHLTVLLECAGVLDGHLQQLDQAGSVRDSNL